MNKLGMGSCLHDSCGNIDNDQFDWMWKYIRWNEDSSDGWKGRNYSRNSEYDASYDPGSDDVLLFHVWNIHYRNVGK